MVRVLLADDQALILESLEMMLNLKEGIQVVGTAHNGREAIELADKLVPDVILMDVRMPVMDGVSSLEIIHGRQPAINIIVLSTFDDDEYVFKALRSGARGYLLKTIPMEELAKAIRTVHAGGALMNPEIVVKVFDHFAHTERNTANGNENSANRETKLRPAEGRPAEVVSGLNRSELKIVKLIGAGHSNKEITAHMNLSEGTVRNYISSILLKLHLRDRTQIALWAVQNGHVPTGTQRMDPA
jgi:DNA-binding NarL/FixJ family response regulator